MNECRDYEELIDRCQMGEASDEESERLLEHLELCEGCSEAFTAVGQLRAGAMFPEPSADDLFALRSGVMRQIRRDRGSRRSGLSSWLSAWFSRPAIAFGFAAVLLLLGFVAGVYVPGPWSPGAEKGMLVAAEMHESLEGSIRTVAARHRNFDDVVDSPYTYTNVRATDAGSGRVNLSFDVSRHMDLTLAKDDPLLSEVLVQSLMGSSRLDARLAAIELAPRGAGALVKSSLIVAMLHDENLAVRIRAQERLVAMGQDIDVAKALLTVLESEPSVQMRLVAIDYLTESNVKADMLERAITAGSPEGSGAVLAKASGYLARQ